MSTPRPGEPTSQLLESYAGVWWRVENPGKFYMALSHSDFYEKGAEGSSKTLPIYEAIVANAANQAMTRAFAIHTAEQVMIADRAEVENHAQKLMQDRLNELDCGIEVVAFTIKDVHPPFGKPNEAQHILGPAGAYEDVVAAMEDKQQMVLRAEGDRAEMVNSGEGESRRKVIEAESYKTQQINTAIANSQQVKYTVEAFKQYPFTFQTRLSYNKLSEAMAQVYKVVLGPGVKPPVVWQEGRDSTPMRPGP